MNNTLSTLSSNRNFLVNFAFFFYGFSIILFDNYKYLTIFYASMIIIVIVFLYELIIKKIELKSDPFLTVYGLFVILTLFSSFFSDDFTYSARRSLNIFFIFFNIYFIYTLNNKYNNFIYIIYGLFFAVFVNFLWLIGFVNLGLDYEGWRFQGSVLQANNFVFILMFSMICITFLLIKENTLIMKIILSILFLICIYLTIMTGSKSGLISLLLLILILSINVLNLKSLFKVLISSFIFITIFIYTPITEYIKENSTLDIEYTITNLENRIDQFFNGISSDNGGGESTKNRIMMLNDAYEMWNESLLFGNGLASFEIKYGHYSHNNIMELLVSFGIIGLFIYYSIYIIILKNIFKIDSLKLRITFYMFILLFITFDQSIVSYTGKFKIMSLLLLLLMIQNFTNKFEVKKIEKN